MSCEELLGLLPEAGDWSLPVQEGLRHMTSNIMRSAIAEGSMPIEKLEEVRADLVWLRDHFDEYQVGNADERYLLYCLCALLCSAIALKP